jgi:hypothetical protein
VRVLPSLRNPVLERELSDQVRGWRPAAVVTLLLVVQSYILYVVYDRIGSDSRFLPDQGIDLVAQGTVVFVALVAIMIGWMTMVVPALCSASIAGERERDTLLPLEITLMGPWSIAIGKLFSSLAFVVLLIIASSPLLAVAYLMGGVSVGDIATAVGVIVWTAFVWACLCLAISALMQRTTRAMVTSYVLIFFIVIGSLFYFAVNWSNTEGDESGFQVLMLNPGILAIDMLGDPDPALQRNGVDTGFDAASRVLHGVDAFRPKLSLLEPDDVPGVFVQMGGMDVGIPPGAVVKAEVMPDGSIVQSITVEDGAALQAVGEGVEEDGAEPSSTETADAGDAQGDSTVEDPTQGVPQWGLEPDGTFDIDKWLLVDGSPMRVSDLRSGTNFLPRDWEPGDSLPDESDPAKDFTRTALAVQAMLAVLSLGVVAWKLRLPQEKIRL